ncbi:phage tail protein [Acidovorax sp. RAC01]|uniref:phage tail protein n=1 Tax=Acidovorax sp. RAC01 TaxID=1842533 RepID=UPI00083E92E8|nr:tail fiber protein [Acidovorax sp. RAC01]AOG24342.1 phage Tail Collar domain protein [Acidovorax sp. RAC01]
MADPFIGEIRAFAFDYAPRNWALCRGQLLPIAQNNALFALIGTSFGGDGRTNFALPDLQDRAPMGQGNGPGLSPRRVGDTAGSGSEVLQPQHMPAHTHALVAAGTPASAAAPAAGFLAQGGSLGSRPTPVPTYASAEPDTPMAEGALAPFEGGGHAHNNMQPYLALNFCICISGSFPTAG